jgi:WD40 repeat protein
LSLREIGLPLGILGIALTLSSAALCQAGSVLSLEWEINLPLKGYGKAHISQNGQFVASYVYGGSIHWYQLGATKPFVIPIGGERDFERVVLSPDGQWVSAVTGRGDLLVWSYGQIKPLRFSGVFSPKTDSTPRIKFSADSNFVAIEFTKETSSVIQLFSLASRAQVYKDETRNSLGFSFNPKTQSLIYLKSYQYDDMNDVSQFVELDAKTLLQTMHVWKGIRSRPEEFIVAPNGAYLVSKNSFAFLALASGEVLYRWEPDPKFPFEPNFNWLAISSQDKYVALSGSSSPVWVIDALSGTRGAPLVGSQLQGMNVTCLSFSADEARVIAGNSRQLSIWNLSTRELEIESKISGCQAVHWNPNSQKIITVTGDWKIQGWQIL